MPSRPHPFRIGDRVRIVVPKIVTRVGYPKSIDDYLVDVDARSLDPVTGESVLDDLVARVLGRNSRLKLIKLEKDPIRDKIRHELAYVLAKRDGFGGTRRSVHLVERPELQDTETTITGLRSVKTGIYEPGGGGTNHFGEDEFYPACLVVDRVVRIASVYTPLERLAGAVFRIGDFVELPTDHLVRVNS